MDIIVGKRMGKCDCTYMFGGVYEPDKINVLEIIEYDFNAKTLYNNQTILMPSLWRIIGDYAEPVKKVLFILWEYKLSSVVNCDWFGEYTFGTSTIRLDKIWLTNKSGITFKNLWKDGSTLRNNYLESMEDQIKLQTTSVADYDSKKQAFGFMLRRFTSALKPNNEEGGDIRTDIKNKFESKFSKNMDIFVEHFFSDDGVKERGYVNIAIFVETDNIIKECTWIDDMLAVVIRKWTLE